MPIKRGPGGGRRKTPFTPTRPKYGIGGKPTGKAAYVSKHFGAGMKNTIRRNIAAHPALPGINRAEFVKRLTNYLNRGA